MSEINTTKEVLIDGTLYVLRAMPVLTAMKIQKSLFDNQPKREASQDDDIPKFYLPDPDIVYQAIKSSVSVGSVLITDKNFDSYFCKKIETVYKLFEEVMAFNFNDGIENEEATDDLGELSKKRKKDSAKS